MGANASSTRRLTVKNDDPRIIQVTEDVVRRLRDYTPPATAAGAVLAEAGSEAAAPSGESGSETLEVGTSSSPATGRRLPAAGLLNIGPDGAPVIETVTAYEVRKQKEEELRQNDRVWGSKLRELEKRYAASAFASQEEFNSKLEKLQSLVPQRRPNPCNNLSAKVAECYSANPKQPLRCSEEVKQFAQCVDRVRA